jgi:hypothetical protein
MAFLAWAILSLAWSPAMLDGIDAVFMLALLAACFCLGNQIESLRPIIIGAALGLTLSSAFALVQWLTPHAPGVGFDSPSGLFVNGNYMAEAAALLVVGAAAERLWWLLPGLMPALLLSHARGAMLATVLAAIVLFRSKTDVVVALSGAVVLAGVWAAFHIDATMADRLDLWSTTARGVTFFGHGIGSFWQVYADMDTRAVVTESPTFAHNEFLHIAFELGIVGLALALAFCALLAGPLDTPRLILIALAVEACFAFPTHLPTTAFLGAVAAGHAVRNRYLLRAGLMRGRRTVAPRVARAGLWPRARTSQAGGAGHAVSASFSRRAVRAGAQP